MCQGLRRIAKKTEPIDQNRRRFCLHGDSKIMELHKIVPSKSKPHGVSCYAHVIYLINYLLTPRCRVLLEQLTGLQLVKKFPAFHGTRKFITALTTVRHLSLSWTSPIRSIYPHPTSWRSVLILSTHLRLGLPSGHLPSGFPSKQ